MKSLKACFTTLVILISHTLAAPVGICLHAYSPEAPAEKIECFEFERFEKTSNSTRFFLLNGRTTIITNYRNRGIVYYPKALDESPSTQLAELEKHARESPVTRKFLNPWILKLRAHVEANERLAETSRRLAKERAALPDIPLKNGRVLKSCKATKRSGDQLTILHADGIKTISIDILSESLKKELDISSLVDSSPPPSESLEISDTLEQLTLNQENEPTETTTNPPPGQAPHQPRSIDSRNSTDAFDGEFVITSDQTGEIENAEATPKQINDTTAAVSEPGIKPRQIDSDDYDDPISSPQTSSKVGIMDLSDSRTQVTIALIVVGLSAVSFFFSTRKHRNSTAWPTKKQANSRSKDHTAGQLVKFHCAHCNAKIPAHATQHGSSINCPSCGKPFTAPHPSTSNEKSESPTVSESIAEDASAPQVVCGISPEPGTPSPGDSPREDAKPKTTIPAYSFSNPPPMPGRAEQRS